MGKKSFIIIKVCVDAIIYEEKREYEVPAFRVPTRPCHLRVL